MAENVVSEISVKLNAPSKSAIQQVNDAADALDKIRSQSRGMTEIGEVTKIIKETGSAASKSANFFSKMVTSLGRIAFYRAIRTVMKEITQAIKEGYTNLIGYSQAMNSMDSQNVFNTMTAYASAFLKIKNSVAAAVSPLVGALLPAIQTVANWFIAGANAVNQFLSALTGHSTYTRATDYVAQIGEQASGSTGKVKELKRTLLGFDEINRLNGDRPSGGGGGGVSTPDYSSMFEEADIAAPFTDLADKLREKVGPELENIKEKFKGVRDAVKDLATAFDDLFGIDFSEFIPTYIAYDLNYFSELLGSVTSVVSSFTKIVKAAKDGDVAGILSGIFDVLVDIVQIAWTPTAAIADFWLNLFGIDFSVLDTLHEVADTVKSFVDGGLETAFSNIADAADKAGKNVRESWRAVTEKLSAWKVLLQERFKDLWEAKIAPWAEDAAIIIRAAWVGVLKKLTEIRNNLRDRFSVLWSGIKEKLSPVITSIKTWWGGVQTKIQGVASAIKSYLEPIWEDIKEKVEPVVTWLKGAWDDISSAVSSVATGIKTIFVSAWQGISSGAATMINGVLDIIGRGVNKIIGFINKYIEKINDFGGAAGRMFGKEWTDIPTIGSIAIPTLSYTDPFSGTGGNNGKGNIYTKANGGWLSAGEMYIAREAGPELVGSIGNRGAVMNNDQIVAAVSQGVASAVASVMGGQQNIQVNVDGQNLFNIVANRNNNIVRQTGMSPLLV